MVGYRHEDSYMEQATNATGDHAIDVSVEQGDFGLNTLPFTTSRVSLTNVNVVPYHDVVRYEHQYPVPVKVVKHLDPTDYEILDVDRNARGRDLKTEICDLFELDESFNVLIFYHTQTQNGVKRRMLTDRGRVEPILALMENPGDKASFDFTDFVELNVNQSGSKEVVIRVFAFTLDHLKAQIEKHFEVKGTDYKIFASDSATGPKLIVEQNSLKDFCVNGYTLYIERQLDVMEAPIDRKRSRQQVPRLIKHVNTAEVNEFDVMLSYSWTTKEQVLGLCDALTEILPGIKIWVDRDEMNGNVNLAMARGILKSSVIIVCLSVAYLNSWNCNKEINFADENKKPIIPAYMFGDLTTEEIQKLKQTPELAAPFIMSTGRMYGDFGSSVKGSEKFQNAVKTIVEELRILLPRFRTVSPAPTSPTDSLNADGMPTFKVPEDPLKKWTEPVDFTADLEAYKKEYVPGTRVWLGEEVSEWAIKSEESSVMWFNGAAGTGKSLLSYYIVNHLPKDKFNTDVFFFCRHNDDEKNDPVSVIKTLVWKLSEQFDAFRAHVTSIMSEDVENMKNGRSSILLDPYVAFQQLISKGFDAIAKPDKVIIITIDALDELDGKTRSVILKILAEECPKLPGYVKLFVTGRPEKDIYDCLTKIGSLELEPTAAENMEDIRKVVVDRFKKIWDVEEPFSKELTECLEIIVDKSEGVFIFVKVVCEFLSVSNVTPEEATHCIEGFSSGPDDVYEAIAQRVIKDVGSDIYHNVLGAILFVFEPLDLESLAILSATPLDQTVDLFDKMRSLLKIIGGEVSIIHKSVKDYFTSDQRCEPAYYIEASATNILLASSCLDILGSVLDASGFKTVSGSRVLPRSFKREVDNSAAIQAAIVKKYGEPIPGPKTSTFAPAKLDLSKLSNVARYSIENLVFHLDTAYLPPNIEDFISQYGPEILLHLACRSGSTNIAQWLLKEKKMNIEAKDAHEKTPLQLAVENRNMELIHLLIENGADLEATDSRGWTALHWAAWNSEDDIVRVLISHHANLNTPAFMDRTPLHVAAWTGKLEITQMMIKAGADFELRDVEGKSPLIMAAEQGHMKVVMYLLGLKANILAHGIWGQTSVHRASANGHFHVVKYLVNHGGPIHISDFYGRYPVSTAARGGHPHVLEYLLDNGGHIDTVDVGGLTPLHEAAKYGQTEAVKFLLSRGANVHAEDNDGRTPVHMAALGCFRDTVRVLIEHGGNVNALNLMGETPLFAVASKGLADVVEVLLEFDADVNGTTKYGETPLYGAASNGEKDVVELLIKNGADVNASNSRDDTVLQAAQRGGYEKIVQLLVKKGAKEVQVKPEVILVPVPSVEKKNAEAVVVVETSAVTEEAVIVASETQEVKEELVEVVIEHKKAPVKAREESVCCVVM